MLHIYYKVSPSPSRRRRIWSTNSTPSFTAHFQSLAILNDFGSQVPFSYTITVAICTILGASIEGLSLFLEVIKSPVAKVRWSVFFPSGDRPSWTDDFLCVPQDIRDAIVFVEPFVEAALGILWFAVLVVVGNRQKMTLVGGCLDHVVAQYSKSVASLGCFLRVSQFVAQDSCLSVRP